MIFITKHMNQHDNIDLQNRYFSILSFNKLIRCLTDFFGSILSVFLLIGLPIVIGGHWKLIRRFMTSDSGHFRPISENIMSAKGLLFCFLMWPDIDTRDYSDIGVTSFDIRILEN